MKFVWVLLVVAVLAVGGWVYVKRPGMSASSAAGLTATAERQTTAVAESRNIRFAVSAAGEITPAEQVSVRPEINGKIATLAVDLGDAVKQGDLLFALDDRDLQIEKETQEKEIERTKVELGQAERNHLRNKRLYEEKLVSEEVFEEFRTRYELSKNAISKAEKSLELVVDRLRKTRIMAPFNCTILTRPVSVGQAVSGSGGFNSGTEVMTIADLTQLIINAHINQADVLQLKPAQQVEVNVEAIQGLKVIGVVERIAPQAIIKNNIKGFSARILLKEIDPRVRPSMTANIKIPVASADNVLSVPLASIFTELNADSQQMERFVYVKTEMGYEKRLVHVGVADFFHAEIQQGLREGEVIALEKPSEEVEKPGTLKSAAPAPAAVTPGSPGRSTVAPRAGADSGRAVRAGS